MRKIDKPTAFSVDEEAAMVHHIKVVAEWGYSFTTLDMSYLAKSYLENHGRHVKQFKNNFFSYECMGAWLSSATCCRYRAA